MRFELMHCHAAVLTSGESHLQLSNPIEPIGTNLFRIHRQYFDLDNEF